MNIEKHTYSLEAYDLIYLFLNDIADKPAPSILNSAQLIIQ